MWNKNKKEIVLTTLLTFIPLIIGLLLWNRLPEMIPVHFGIDGQPDNYYPKLKAVCLLGLFLPLLHILCIFGTMSDPKRNNISKKVFNLVLWITPIVGALMSVMTYGSALGLKVDVVAITSLLIGIVFIILGNYLPKCRQNYTVGIKIPWTLNDKDNWDKTHRFAGYVYIIAGIIMICSMFLKGKILIFSYFINIFIASLLPVVYSYILYRKSLTDK